MKKAIAVILSVTLLCLVFGIALSAKQDAKRLDFLVLGDSIAAGSGVRNQEEQAYAWIVAREKGWALTNYGAGGDISADLLRKVKEDEEIRRAIRAADVIAVSTGGNDLLHAEEFYGLIYNGLLGDYSQQKPVHEAFRANFAGIIKGIRALNPDAALVVQTLYQPAFSIVPPSLYDAYGAAIRGINAGIYEYYGENPCDFLLADVYSAFEQRYGAVFIDMTHPSAIGHAVIAQVLLAAIDGVPAVTARTVWDDLIDAALPLLMPWLRRFDSILVAALRMLKPILSPVMALIDG